MRITVPYAQEKFEEFNRLMFNDRLPALPIRLTDAGSFLGKCAFSVTRSPDGLKTYSDFSLRFNTRYDLPENEWEDVIVHEMIHYLILWIGLQDSSPHGEIFKAIMRSINSAHGRNISVRHTEMEPGDKPDTVARRKVHIIAVISFKSGLMGVKVLPRKPERILEYNRVVGSHPQVEKVRFFIHHNPFFDRFPTSGAFRYHDIDRAVLEKNLENARQIKINGTQISVY